MKSGFGFKNVWEFVCRDAEGNVKWIEIVPNHITYEGLDNILNTYFINFSYFGCNQAWYAGLISNNYGMPTLAQTDVASQITVDAMGSNNWGEDTNYNESYRPTINWAAASSQSITNSASPCVFTMNASTTILGAFVISESTKAGTYGVLFKEAAFSAGAQSVKANDTITLTITITVASV